MKNIFNRFKKNKIKWIPYNEDTKLKPNTRYLTAKWETTALERKDGTPGKGHWHLCFHLTDELGRFPEYLLLIKYYADCWVKFPDPEKGYVDTSDRDYRD